MRIVMMGTPQIAVSVMERLVDEGYELVGVVSQPDKKVGRKQIVACPPLKQAAQAKGIDVFQPIKIKEDYQPILAWKPDLIVTCAYGQFIPETLLEAPRYGSLNVHTSLLPKLRGGAPIHKAILYGYEKTGVSIMRMVKKMDAGPVMLQKTVIIEPDDTMRTLHDRLTLAACDAISEAIPLLVSANAVFKEQDEHQATYAYAITKEEELIDPDRDVQDVYNHIRALIDDPVGHIVIDHKSIKIHEARMGNQNTDHAVGTLYAEGKKCYLQCKNGSVELLNVQMEGKNKMSAKDFMNGAGRRFLK